jgi:hypothetical protein
MEIFVGEPLDDHSEKEIEHIEMVLPGSAESYDGETGIEPMMDVDHAVHDWYLDRGYAAGCPSVFPAEISGCHVTGG